MSYRHKEAIRNAQVGGLEEVTAFLYYMSSKEKNVAIKRVHRLATTKYRAAIKGATPENQDRSLGMSRGGLKKVKRTRLINTIGFIDSEKYKGKSEMIAPLWVGHLVKKGAYHQHLIVRGTKAWSQNGTPTQRMKNGSKKRKKLMVFATGGALAFGVNKKAVARDDYVTPIALAQKDGIVDSWGDNFVIAMKKEANKPKYKKYLS